MERNEKLKTHMNTSETASETKVRFWKINMKKNVFSPKWLLAETYVRFSMVTFLKRSNKVILWLMAKKNESSQNFFIS